MKMKSYVRLIGIAGMLLGTAAVGLRFTPAFAERLAKPLILSAPLPGSRARPLLRRARSTLPVKSVRVLKPIRTLKPARTLRPIRILKPARTLKPIRTPKRVRTRKRVGTRKPARARKAAWARHPSRPRRRVPTPRQLRILKRLRTLKPARRVGRARAYVPTGRANGRADHFVVEVNKLKAIWTSECGRRKNPSFCDWRDEVYFKVIGVVGGRSIDFRVPRSGARLSRAYGGADYYGLHNGESLRRKDRIRIWEGWLRPGEHVSLVVAMLDQENNQLDFIKQVFKSLASLAVTALTGGVTVWDAVGELVQMGTELVRSFVGSNHQLLGTFSVHLRNEGNHQVVEWVSPSRGRIRPSSGGALSYHATGANGNYNVGVVAWRDCSRLRNRDQRRCEAASRTVGAQGSATTRRESSKDIIRRTRWIGAETERCGRERVEIRNGTFLGGNDPLLSHRSALFAVLSPEIRWTCRRGRDVSEERTVCPDGTNLIHVIRGAERRVTFRCGIR